jgi:hypothetical protein
VEFRGRAQIFENNVYLLKTLQNVFESVITKIIRIINCLSKLSSVVLGGLYGKEMRGRMINRWGGMIITGLIIGR